MFYEDVKHIPLNVSKTCSTATRKDGKRILIQMMWLMLKGIKVLIVKLALGNLVFYFRVVDNWSLKAKASRTFHSQKVHVGGM